MQVDIPSPAEPDLPAEHRRRLDGAIPSTSSEPAAQLATPVGLQKRTTKTHPIPWDHFPEDVQIAIRENRHLHPRERRDLNKVLSIYICSVLRDTRLETVTGICSEITAKKPRTFVATVGGKVTGNGCESWARKLYYAVQFRKATVSDESLRPKKRAKRRRPGDASAADKAAKEDAADDPEAVPEPLALDSYGCVLWKPRDLPRGETVESQEKQRDWLSVNFRFRGSEDDSQVEAAMRNTYNSQRGDIVSRTTLLEPVLKSWPFLRVSKYFWQHASTLLAKDVCTIWNQSLEQKAFDLLKYLAYACSERKKKSASTAHKMRLSAMSEEIGKAKTSSNNLNSQLPKTIALFPLLDLNFREDIHDLVKLEPVSKIFL